MDRFSNNDPQWCGMCRWAMKMRSQRLAEPGSWDHVFGSYREDAILEALEELSYRERVVLRRRRDGTKRTAIGLELGVSGERVRQIELAALRKLDGILQHNERLSSST
jgi:DNA-directed RNA polymerase sigma subunit (sigma70/sigma32)